MRKNTIITGDSTDLLKCARSNSVDAIIIDPPYNISFFNEKWDKKGSGEEFSKWVEEWGPDAHRVLREGGSILSFASPRMYHWMAVGLEKSGFITRDMIEWIYWCCAEDTEALTKDGFKTIDEVTLDDEIATFNIETEEIEYQKPLGINVQDHDGPMVRINSPDMDQLVTPNHRLVININGSWNLVMAMFACGTSTVTMLALTLHENGLVSIAPIQITDMNIVTYTGRVWCPSTPNGTFVARRNGKIFITGNSGMPKGKTTLKPAHEPIYWGMKNTKNTALKDLNFVVNIDDTRIPYKDDKDKKTAQNNAEGFVKRTKQDFDAYKNGLPRGFKQLPDVKVHEDGRYTSNTISTDENEGHLSEDKYIYLNEPTNSYETVKAGANRRNKSVERGKVSTFLKKDTGTQGADPRGVYPRNVITDSNFMEDAYINQPDGKPKPNIVYGNSPMPMYRLVGVKDEGRVFTPNDIGRYPSNILTTKDLDKIEEAYINEPKNEHSTHHKKKYVRKTNSTFFKDGMEDKHQAHPRGRHPANIITEHDLDSVEILYLNQPIGDPSDAWNVNRKPKHSGYRSKGMTNRLGVDKASPNGRYPSNLLTEHDLDKIHIRTADGLYPSNLLDIPKASKNDKTMDGKVSNTHPTIKPTKLMSWLVKLVTNEGDTVLDFFSGSGTTLVSAKQNCRNYLGIDMTPEYVNIADQRLGVVKPTCQVTKK